MAIRILGASDLELNRRVIEAAFAFCEGWS